MIDIKAIREAAENYPSPWPMSLQPATVLALCDEIERLRKDAARYRFMRDRPNHEIKRRKGRVAFVPRFTNYEYDTFTTLDAAIDAAMESKT